jgi:pilus assembly protein Flp/PilA
MTKLYRFMKDESGVTAIEYGLIAACIGVAIVMIIQTVGTDLVNIFTRVSTALHRPARPTLKKPTHRFPSLREATKAASQAGGFTKR